jgi:hypothetical protein
VPSVSSVSGADGAPVGLVLEDTGERLAFGERGLPEIHKHSMPAERGLKRPVSWSTNGDL